MCEFLGVVFACQIWGVRVRMFSFLMQGISRLRSARSSRGRVFWDSRVRLVLFLMQGISRLTLEMTSCSLGFYKVNVNSTLFVGVADGRAVRPRTAA